MGLHFGEGWAQSWLETVGTKGLLGLITILVALVALALPAALTIGTIVDPGTLQVATDNPSPHGYTVSLLIFLIPDVLMCWWIYKKAPAKLDYVAFAVTVVLITLVGTVLDLFLCYHWFEFPNTGAVLGLYLPAYEWGVGWHSGYLPIEEWGFYSLGGLFMVSLYVTGDLFWMKASSHPRFTDHARSVRGNLIQLNWAAVWIGLAVIALGWGYKAWFTANPGFPGYFAFLTVIGVVPTVLFLPTVRPVINWQAFSLLYAVLLGVSLLWEATLGVPYNWWNYKHEAMLGIFVGPWAGLPLEAVMMWFVSVWGATIVYIVLRLWHHGQAQA